MLFQNSAEAPNGEPYAEHTVYQESPQKETIFIAVPDEDHVDLGILGEYQSAPGGHSGNPVQSTQEGLKALQWASVAPPP